MLISVSIHHYNDQHDENKGGTKRREGRAQSCHRGLKSGCARGDAGDRALARALQGSAPCAPPQTFRMRRVTER